MTEQMRSNSVQSSADASLQAIMVVLLISHGYLVKPKYKTKCKGHNKGIKVSMLIKTLIPELCLGFMSRPWFHFSPIEIERDFIKFFYCQVHIAFDSRVTNT